MTNFTRRSLFHGGAALLATSGIAANIAVASATSSKFKHREIFMGANEYPDGPSEAAKRAIASITQQGGRYLDDFTIDLVKLYAGKRGIDPKHVQPFAGTFMPLNWTSLAFTSPTAPLVAADPTFTIGLRRAELIKTPLHLLPLRSDYTHDTKELVRVAHEKQAGLLYICSPNNPTGTVTRRADIVYAIDNKPKDTVVVVDEAYLDFCDEPSVVDLVGQGKDLVVLHSFSKIYGLAGIRLGFAIARPDLLARINRFGWSPLPITAVAAGVASLEDADLVPTRKRATAKSRADLVGWLAAKGYSTSPSDASFFLIDVKRPGGDFIKGLKARGVNVGRVWLPYANAFRLTIGSPAENEIFKREFTAVEEELRNVPVAPPATAALHEFVEWSRVG